MFFCSKCDNIYDVTSKINKTIDDELTPTSVSDDTSVSEKQNNKSEKNDENDDNNDDNTNVAYFMCDNCGHSEPLPEDTVIITKSSTRKIYEHYDKERCRHMINIKTLPLTRNYVCHNTKCESHNNHTKREAVFFRVNNTYAVRYICKACLETWI